MSALAAVYTKARGEIIALFGWDADSLSPDQVLRVDCATALRLAIDALQGQIIRGESFDVNRMLTACEALARLLPPAVLATPPAESCEPDPRQVLCEIYRRMRERGEIGLKADRVAELEDENERLRGQLVDAGLMPALPEPRAIAEHVPHFEEPRGSTIIDPPTSDIVPPGERAERDSGPRPGPDDPPPRSQTIIEGKAERAAPASAAPRQPSWDSSAHAAAWRAWRDGAPYDRWKNNG